MIERTLEPTGGTGLRGKRAVPRGVYDPSFFLRRTAAVVGMALVFMALGALSGTYVGFDFMQAILDVPGGLMWMATQFVPSLTSLQKLDTILPALGSTILASIASSCTAAACAYICAVLGSRSVGVGGPFPLIVRAVASLFRNIPVVAWAFILLFSFKQSEFTGFFALFLTSFGYLTRCFLESIDEMSAGPVEALRASGATYGQIVAQAVIPMSITSVISWVMYMIETNIRDATLIGLLTGTGIGFVFDVYYKSFRYDIAGLVILSIILVVIACELTSNFVRRKIVEPAVLPNGRRVDAAASRITRSRGDAGSSRTEVRFAPAIPTTSGTAETLAGGTNDLCDMGVLAGARTSRSGKIKVHVASKSNVALYAVLGVLAAITVFALAVMDYGKVAFPVAMAAAVDDFVTMMTQPGLGGHFTLPDVMEGLFVSLALALLTTFIGAVIAFVLGLLASCNLSSKGMSNAIKVFMSVARAVPTILWVLVFSVAIGLGPEAAVTGLLFHSVAYLVKAYSESFEEVDAGVLEALRASGASWWQVVFQGVVPEKVNEMLSWTFIRFEINFVNAVAVGAVAGAGGIGYQLFLAGSFYYNIHEVGLIVYLCLAVAVVLEAAATKLRKRYIVQH